MNSCHVSLRALALVQIAILASTCAAPNIGDDAASSVAEGDYEVVGTSPGADSASVRRLLGSPTTAVLREGPFGDHFAFWTYPGLDVFFNEEGTVMGLLVTGGELPTARGARVGDAKSRILALYGTPAIMDRDRWSYGLPGQHELQYRLTFVFAEDEVRQIFVGSSFD